MKYAKKALAIILSFVMIICILPLSTLTVSAASNPYPNYNYYNNASDYQIACTWYAWKQVYERQGIALPAWGNARSWYSAASNAGYSVGSTPKAGAIACWSSGTYGHVAYVTGVNANGSFNIVEGGSRWSGNDHGVCSRTVSQGQYWPEQGFIYVNSVSTTPSVTFNAWSNASYTFVNDTNAAIGQEILISNGNCTKTGMYLYNSNQTFIASAENPSYTLAKVFFNINKELKTTLKHATKYYYKFYAVVNGQTYWSNMNSFTTTGQHTYTTIGYDAAHPHKIYKKCACGDRYYTGETETLANCSSCRYITSISINKKPYKTTYYVGDQFDANGLVLLLKYSDNTTDLSKSYSQISGFDSSVLGKQTITVYYKTPLKKLSTSFIITIKAPTVKIPDVKLNAGEEKALTAETDMPGGTTITWSSNNTNIATVSNGIVKAKDVGKATITAAITVNGKRYSDTCTVEVTSVYKKGWVKSGNRWWYQYSDGSYAKGWKKIDDQWYYFDGSGWMQTGWQYINSNWYYFSPASGFMHQNQWIGGYYLTAEGRMATSWTKINNSWYYFSKEGHKKIGWLCDNNEWYYLNGNGVMATGWLHNNNHWYYLNGEGIMETGWCKVDGTWYYLAEEGGQMCRSRWVGSYYITASGKMAVGWQQINGVWYFFDTNGIRKTNWQRINNTWYYFSLDDGQMCSNRWVGSYYITANGKMAVGWQQISGVWYFFDTNGIRKTGWQRINDVWYYFSLDDGHMYADKWIGNHYVNLNGAWNPAVKS